MASAPASNADTIRCFVKRIWRGSCKKKPLSTAGTVFRDPFFEQLFSKMKLYKTPCPEDVPGATNAVDNGIGNRLGSPLRGRTALRVQSS